VFTSLEVVLGGLLGALMALALSSSSLRAHCRHERPTGRLALSVELVEKAEAAAKAAYAPYSSYLVGAVVRTRDGRVAGVNVENAAYPLGMCAEKTAIGNAVTAGYKPRDLVAIGITASPCGGCRQWLHEFRIEEISYRREDGTIATATIADLLPTPEPARMRSGFGGARRPAQRRQVDRPRTR
jgi:cytidine deaminase